MSQWSEDYLLEKIITYSWHSYILQAEITSLDYRYVYAHCRRGLRIFEQTIPRTESLAETASEGVSIFSYDGKSKGADSYRELVQEVLKHA